MHIIDYLTALLVLSAGLSYLNSRFFKLPPMISLMLGSLGLAICLVLLDHFDVPYGHSMRELLSTADFSNLLLHGILSYFLFAGALQVDVHDLAVQRTPILVLSTIGVLISTFVVGTIMYYVFHSVGITLPYLYALMFGALISPTDPVVVMRMLRGAPIPKSLKMKIIGESLFNDGIALVLFVVIFGIAQMEVEITVGDVIRLIGRQVLGSLFAGVALGWLIARMLHSVREYSEQILISLGLVGGGYWFANYLGISAPVTVAIAGLLFRTFKERIAKVKPDYTQLYIFWGLLDEFLNATLFIMMGLELITVPFTAAAGVAGAIAIVVVLFGRYVSVWIPVRLLSPYHEFSPNAVRILTWSGLRGGISLAIALSLPPSPASYAIASATYMVVLFSTLVQGLTLRRVLR